MKKLLSTAALCAIAAGLAHSADIDGKPPMTNAPVKRDAKGDLLPLQSYDGDHRIVWRVAVEGGETIQNQERASRNYQSFPIGWLNFPKPGKYKVRVACLDGNLDTASLKSIYFTPLNIY